MLAIATCLSDDTTVVVATATGQACDLCAAPATWVEVLNPRNLAEPVLASAGVCDGCAADLDWSIKAAA